MKRTTLFLFVAIFLSFTQVTKVEGVITYYFNDYQGDKPDLGAEVFLIKKSQCNFNVLALDTFQHAVINRTLYSMKYEAGLEITQELKDNLKKWKGVPQEAFDALDTRAYVAYKNISTKGKHSVVDAMGRYSIAVTPGKYYIYIQSKGRTGLSITEVSGKIFFKELNVIPGSNDVSNNFKW